MNSLQGKVNMSLTTSTRLFATLAWCMNAANLENSDLGYNIQTLANALSCDVLNFAGEHLFYSSRHRVAQGGLLALTLTCRPRHTEDRKSRLEDLRRFEELPKWCATTQDASRVLYN